MKKRNTALLLCALLLLAAFLTGCGGSGTAAMDAGGNASSAPSEPYYDMEKMEADASMAAPMGTAIPGLQYAVNDAVVAEQTEEMGVETTTESGTAAPSFSQKLIYTVDLTVETLEYERSLETVEQLTAEFGGYVEYAQVDNNRINTKWLRDASFILRIPADRLEVFLESCGSVGNVCSSVRRTENRTTEYADLNARLETMRIEEDTLQELLGKAEDLETIVALNAHLSDVRYEIERVESRMRSIDGLVSYSTVNLYLEEVTVASDPVTPQSSFGERVADRMSSSWRSFTRGLERFGVFALGELPLVLLSVLLYLIPVAIVLVVLFVIIRRVRRKRREKQLLSPEPVAPAPDDDTEKE